MYGGGREVSGAWNEHTHTTVHKTDNKITDNPGCPVERTQYFHFCGP